MKKCGISRRSFLGTAGSAVAVATLVPRHAVAGSGKVPPSEQLRVVGIGVGGQGHVDIRGVADVGLSDLGLRDAEHDSDKGKKEKGKEKEKEKEKDADKAKVARIVALCDVDQRRGAESFKIFPEAKQYRDFRKLFDEMEKQIDAVVVATPDHTHAVAVAAAIQRKKHVYCEKPLAHAVAEVRHLMLAAKQQNVVTQLGNQGHSFDSCRVFCEWIWDGAIGNVHTIHCGCSIINSAIKELAHLKEKHEAPNTLDWDLWLGPAQDRPYHPSYLPGSWRGWVPFGNGTIGDWMCHVVDPVFWALDLGAPATVESHPTDYDPKKQADAYPKGEKITMTFPAKAGAPGTPGRGPITLYWYSGTEKIPRPEALEAGATHHEVGAVVLGDKGTIHYGSHGAGGVRIIPEPKMKAYKLPKPSIPRVRGGHHADWLRAIVAGKKAGSDFSYGGPLTELALLGVIASKLPDTKLHWDSAAMRFTNSEEANSLLDPPYRKGWTL